MGTKKHLIWLYSVLVLSAGPVLAADTPQLSLQVSGQEYQWREYNDAGTRLLEESGERFAIGAGYDNLNRQSSGVLYSGTVKFYLGNVNYDGQTQGGVPVQTDVNYYGLNLEGLGGYRFGQRIGLDVFAGGGIDEWKRSLQDSTDSLGNPVSGYDEVYLILYGRAGLGFFQLLDSWSYKLQGGVKMPLFTTEHINFAGTDVYLSPGLKASLFANVQFDFGVSRNGRFAIALFYDSFRFSKSDPEVVYAGGTLWSIWQPRSEQDVYGLRFNYYFF